MPISLLRSESKFYCILAKIEGRRAAVEGGEGGRAGTGGEEKEASQ